MFYTKYFFTSIIRILFTLFFIPSVVLATSLETSVINMLRTNPEIQDKKYELKGIEEEKDIINADYYPKINLSAGIGKAKQKTTPAYNTQSGDLVTRSDNSITASMNLFKGFFTYHDSNALDHRINAQKSFIAEHTSSMIMKTIESYVHMMKQKAIVLINKENVYSHETFYAKLKQLTDSGLGKVSDLKLLSNRLTLAKINAVVHENNFIQAKMDFETLIGHSVDTQKLKEPLFDYIFPETLEIASLEALNNNPSIKSSEHNIKSSMSNYKKSQSFFYPSIDIELRESKFEESGNYDYSVDSSYAMMYITFNIFNGFADKAAAEKEFAFYLQNKEYLRYIKRDVIKRIGISWIAATKIKEQLDLLDKMQIDSKSTLDDYYEEYLFGRRTILDIMNVKNDYANAKQSYEIAKYDLLLAKFRILNSLGGLENYFLSKEKSLQNIQNFDYVEQKSVDGIVKNISDKLYEKRDFIIINEGDLNESINSFIDQGKDDEENDEEDLFG